jgi:predicted nucleic-acid-binding protein
MNSYILDTNALISFITDRDKLQQSKIAKYFEEAALINCELIIIDAVINEFVYVLEQVYQVKPADIAEMIKALIKTPGIKLTGSFNIESLLNLWPIKIYDYGDAVLGEFAKTSNLPIITFDKKLIKQLIKEKIPVKKI